MKKEIYNEIQRMENSSNDFLKKKGIITRLMADNITCFKCIDTKRSWKNKNNTVQMNVDGKGNYDIVGCHNCNNVGFISSSHTNDLIYNGYKLFNVDNNNWIERIEQIHNKASRDINIINKVNEQMNKQMNKQIDENDKFKINQVEGIKTTKVDTLKDQIVKDQIVKVQNIKDQNIKEQNIKDQTMPLFEVCKRITKVHVEKSLNVDIEVGKIIDIVKSAVETYFGNTFSLNDLVKELRISFSIANGKSTTTDKLIKIKNNNYLGIKTSTNITQNIIKTGLFGKNKFAKEYTADIFILKPLNQKATEKANMIMGKIGEEMTNDILNVF